MGGSQDIRVMWRKEGGHDRPYLNAQATSLEASNLDLGVESNLSTEAEPVWTIALVTDELTSPLVETCFSYRMLELSFADCVYTPDVCLRTQNHRVPGCMVRSPWRRHLSRG